MDAEKKSGPTPWIAIVISVAAFIVSLTTLYFTHFYTSEALYALVLELSPVMMEETNYNSDVKNGIKDVDIDIALINKGNQNIIISKLELTFKHWRMGAQEPETEHSATPILLHARSVEQIPMRFNLEPASDELISSNPEELVNMHVWLLFTTIGISGGVQESEIGPIKFIVERNDTIKVIYGDTSSPVMIRE